MTLVLDSSVWVSAALPDDEHHGTTRKWLERVSAEAGLLLPALGLAETAGAVARRTGSATLARRAITAIQALPSVTIVVPDQ